MKIQEVNEIFLKEFGDKAKCFDIVHLKIRDAMSIVNPMASRPGVYLFWHPKFDVVMVGKHQSNSKKRALDHIRDNTKNDIVELGSMKDDSELDLYLFNIIDDKDKHWVLALEAFFEWNLNPTIKAHRMG